jgi:catechol 2,3-dioxygenase-like lactoylglutathione lyase family enzyme
MPALNRVMAFLATTDAPRAIAFYRDVLELTFVEDSPYALVFRSGETMLRIQRVDEVTPPPFTSLGWEVDDIAQSMRDLLARGVAFLRFGFVVQDELGIWAAPDGTRVAWFKDPDGHTLSLTQFSAA